MLWKKERVFWDDGRLEVQDGKTGSVIRGGMRRGAAKLNVLRSIRVRELHIAKSQSLRRSIMDYVEGWVQSLLIIIRYRPTY